LTSLYNIHTLTVPTVYATITRFVSVKSAIALLNVGVASAKHALIVASASIVAKRKPTSQKN
jgi:hypothetical protein